MFKKRIVIFVAEGIECFLTSETIDVALYPVATVSTLNLRIIYTIFKISINK